MTARVECERGCTLLMVRPAAPVWETGATCAYNPDYDFGHRLGRRSSAIPATRRTMSVTAFLFRLHKMGVSLGLEGGRLSVQGPDEVLTEEIRAQITSQEVEITEFLREMMGGGAEPEAPVIETVSRDSDPVTSFAQARFWLLCELGEDAAAYALPLAWRLRGPLDVAALGWGFGEIVRRHEALRTTFRVSDEDPLQHIAPPSPVELPVVDLSETADPITTARRRAREDVLRPFDLAAGPLYRATLFRIGTDDHLLAIVIHHMVGDGLSLGIIHHELAELYAARLAGDPSPLEDLPLQYADYAVWQRRQYAQARDDLREFWTRELAGVATLDLPTDKPRPPKQTYRCARQHFEIDPALVAKLDVLGRDHGCTMFMVTLAAFKLLLARTAGQTDISVGTPIANRSTPDLESMVGLFLNTVVLRTEVSADLTIRDLLRAVQRTALRVQRHRDMPLDELTAALGVERDASHNPLFQALFNFLPAPPAPPLPHLESDFVELEEASSLPMDVSMWIRQPPGGLRGDLEYNVRLFEATSGEQIAQRYIRLLEAMVGDPDTCVWELPIMTPSERQRVLVDYNATDHDFPAEACLHHLFEEQVARTPDASALLAGDEHLTFAEVNDRANRVAHHLIDQQVGPGAIVGICIPRSPVAVVAMFGVLKTGASYLPLDPSYPAKRLALMADDSGVELVLSVVTARGALPPGEHRVIELDQAEDTLAACSERNPERRGAASDPAYIIYTSGSTGAPRGVIGLHRGAINRIAWMWGEYPYRDGEVACATTALNFVDSISETFAPLLAGVPLAIIPDEDVVDSQALIATLTKLDISRIVLVPSLLRAMLDAGDLTAILPALRTWVCSGEALPTDLAERLVAARPDATLLNLYGFSEASADAAAYDTRRGLGGAHGVPIGKPIWNTRIYLLDDRQQPVPPGVRGEVWVGGVGLARGYLHCDELTAEKFVAAPFAEGDARMYRSGDLARWNHDGELEFCGRVDQQLEIRGFRVEAGEVEAALARVDSVEQCAVVARRGASGDTQLVAFVVATPGAEVTAAELRAVLRDQLPDYMVPSMFVACGAMPLLPSGKIDRRSLQQREIQPMRAPAATRVAPRNQLESDIVRVVQRVLGLSELGVEDNLFEVGLDSLLAQRVAWRLNEKVHVRVPVRFVLEGRTVADLCKYVQAAHWAIGGRARSCGSGQSRS